MIKATEQQGSRAATSQLYWLLSGRPPSLSDNARPPPQRMARQPGQTCRSKKYCRQACPDSRFTYLITARSPDFLCSAGLSFAKSRYGQACKSTYIGVQAKNSRRPNARCRGCRSQTAGSGTQGLPAVFDKKSKPANYHVSKLHPGAPNSRTPDVRCRRAAPKLPGAARNRPVKTRKQKTAVLLDVRYRPALPKLPGSA